MSHDGSWRAACLIRCWIPILHSKVPSVARGVTAPGVGSGALLAAWFFLTTKPVPMTSGRFAGSTSATFIRGLLSPTRNPDFCHREPSFRKLIKTRATLKSNDSRSTPTNRTSQGTAHRDLLIWLTSKMSHDRGWRAACVMRIWSLTFHFGDS